MIATPSSRPNWMNRYGGLVTHYNRGPWVQAFRILPRIYWYHRRSRGIDSTTLRSATGSGEGASAPGAPAITHDGVGTPINLWSVFTPNPIYQVVDTPRRSLTNIALPGHAFLDQVTSTVEPLGNGSIINVVGTGVGGEAWWRGAFNNAAGYLLFGERNYLIQKG